MLRRYLARRKMRWAVRRLARMSPLQRIWLRDRPNSTKMTNSRMVLLKRQVAMSEDERMAWLLRRLDRPTSTK